MAESEATFKERARDIGVAETDIASLAANDIKTFGQFAFVCPSNPASGDETELKKAFEHILGSEPDPTKMVVFRRLYFESHAIAMSELKSRLERSSTDAPKQISLAERMIRLKRQRDDLKGIILDSLLEPAHNLVDKIQSMVEDGAITYLAPEKCASREHEITGDGALKVTRKAIDLKCDTQGETKLRSALTRRSLAFDQIGLMSFAQQETWHSKLFNLLQRAPPAGHRYVTIQQILTADRELWTQIAQASRGALQIVAGKPAPLDSLMKEWMNAPEVTSCLLPLPHMQSHGGNETAPPPIPPKDPKGKGKGKTSKIRTRRRTTVRPSVNC